MHGHHFDAVRLAAAEDVGALAEQIFELDVPVEPPAAREEYMQAVDAFEAAERRLDSADRPENLETISALVAEGRYRMAAVRAIREGRAVPRRFPPCFFDFRHGPAVELIVWSPIGGDPRTVPVCARDADLVERDLQPKPRQLVVDHREIPFWDAPAEFGPWFRGAYEPGDVCRAAKLLDGLILGARLGETG